MAQYYNPKTGKHEIADKPFPGVHTGTAPGAPPSNPYSEGGTAAPTQSDSFPGTGGITYRPKPVTGQTQSGTQSSTSESTATTNQTQTQQTVFEGPQPEYEKPPWDEGEIRKLSRKISAPGIRALRQSVNQAMAKYYENPNIKRMMVRDALQGYGLGLGNVQAKAETQARGEYAQRYSFDVNAATAKFNAAWQAYLAGGKTTSTTTGSTVTTGTQTGTTDQTAQNLFGTQLSNSPDRNVRRGMGPFWRN